MANQTISAHVAVINPSTGKASAAKTTQEAETAQGEDFAHVLSSQIQSDSTPVENKAVTVEIASEVDNQLINNGENQAQAQLGATPAETVQDVSITLLQNVHIKIQVDSGNCCQDHGESDSSDLALDRLLNTPAQQANLGAITGLEKAAKETADPAKLAAGEKALPFETLLQPKTEVGSQNQALVNHFAPVNAVAQGNGNTAPVALPPIPVPVGQEGWENAFSQRVVWAATSAQQVAQLQLNPPNLGPIEIRISLNSDQTNASFVSPHAAVREAIEAALPRLRDMLADNGLSLGNVNVSSESFQQQAQQQAQHGQGHGRDGQHDARQLLHTLVDAGVPGAGIVTSGVAHLVQGRNGLVDLFA